MKKLFNKPGKYWGRILAFESKKLVAWTLTFLLILCAVGSYFGSGYVQASKKTKSSEVLSGQEKLLEYSSQFETTPHTKEDGSKYRFAYVDYDEYLPASRHLYYILAGLEELGWIKKDSIPFSTRDIDEKNLSTKTMYQMLVTADLGDYIEFVDGGFFYLGYDDEKVIADSLTSKAGKDIDIVLTFGTSAGVFVKELNLPITMLDYSATDPVASGIIASTTEGSGNPLVWADFEPSVPQRQLIYYHSVCPFYKAGLVCYGDETISGIADIESAGKQIGFDLVKYNIEEQPRETPEELEAYYQLVADKIKSMSNEGIDAFILTVDLINDLDRLAGLLEPLYEKNIPVYTMDDTDTIKYGGLMLVSCNDVENLSKFVAETIAKVLNGAEAGMMPCIYYSSPGIYYNYTVGKRIRYPVKFDFLVACDRIFK